MVRGIAHDFSFTSRQRRVLVVLLLVAGLFFAIKWAINRSVVPDPQPAVGLRADELADRIDLETTDWQTLAILPGIGESKARDILRKRDELQSRTPGQRAFARAEDLYFVKGIGAATVEKLKPYLYFPGTPSTRDAE